MRIFGKVLRFGGAAEVAPATPEVGTRNEPSAVIAGGLNMNPKRSADHAQPDPPARDESAIGQATAALSVSPSPESPASASMPPQATPVIDSIIADEETREQLEARIARWEKRDGEGGYATYYRLAKRNEELRGEVLRMRDLIESEIRGQEPFVSRKSLLDEIDDLKSRLAGGQGGQPVVNAREIHRAALGENRAVVAENARLRSELGRLQEQIVRDRSESYELLRTLADERVPPPFRSRQIVFMHIMKTAGTSVQRFLTSVMPGVPLYHANEVGFDAISAEELSRYGLVLGHLSHRHLAKTRRPFVITFLRDPIERTLSHLTHMSEGQDGPTLSPEMQAFRSMSLGDYIRSKAPFSSAFIENHQAYTIASDWRDDRTMSGAELRDVAGEHLEAMGYVGVVERADDDIAALAKVMEVTAPPALGRENRSTKRMRREDLNSEDLTVIMERNAVDIELYDRYARPQVS